MTYCASVLQPVRYLGSFSFMAGNQLQNYKITNIILRIFGKTVRTRTKQLKNIFNVVNLTFLSM